MFIALIDSVRAGINAAGFEGQIIVDEGSDAPNAQTNYGAGGANRVVFSAADDLAFGPAITVGEIETDEDGGAARSILTTTFMFRVAIAGYDPDFPARDMAHRQACLQIFQLVAQQVQAFAPGQTRWTAGKFTNERKVGQFGRELVATLELDLPIVDSASLLVTPVRGVLENPTAKRPA